MSAFLEFISNNSLVSTVLGAAILGALGWFWRWYHNRRDSNTIYNFLVNSNREFRSTEAIASNTKLSEERVAYICARDVRIRRNEREKQSWTLAVKQSLPENRSRKGNKAEN